MLIVRHRQRNWKRAAYKHTIHTYLGMLWIVREFGVAAAAAEQQAEVVQLSAVAIVFVAACLVWSGVAFVFVPLSFAHF